MTRITGTPPVATVSGTTTGDERSTRRHLALQAQALEPPPKSLRPESTLARERFERSPGRTPTTRVPFCSVCLKRVHAVHDG
jgi:hypothetical protein